MESECKAKQVSEIKVHVIDLKAEAECRAKEAAWMAEQTRLRAGQVRTRSLLRNGKRRSDLNLGKSN